MTKSLLLIAAIAGAGYLLRLFMSPGEAGIVGLLIYGIGAYGADEAHRQRRDHGCG